MPAGVAFHHQITLGPDTRHPWLLYTDATGKGYMGYTLYDSRGRLQAWSALRRPPLCAAGVKPRKNQVTAWETIAPAWALLQERRRLQGQRIHVFVDNA